MWGRYQELIDDLCVVKVEKKSIKSYLQEMKKVQDDVVGQLEVKDIEIGTFWWHKDEMKVALKEEVKKDEVT